MDSIRAKANSRTTRLVPYTNSVVALIGSEPLPSPNPPPWSPKNPDIVKNITMSPNDCSYHMNWEDSSFPIHHLPKEVETHVDVNEWKSQLEALRASGAPEASLSLLEKVLLDLHEGCDSHVMPPGNSPTVTANVFSDPAVDLPRIADALAEEVKAGHMAGPFPVGFIENSKVNGLLSIVKPTGARRQVGNLSAPKGISFNDCISPETLKSWQVHQTTSKQFANKISRAGPCAVMSCSDMVSAYKCLPVCLEQRKLQVFRFLGREFVDLRLIFGDKAACMYYDRFHHCIVVFFVLEESWIPRGWIGRTIDDLTTVCPRAASHITSDFVSCYKKVLRRLNIGVAPEDPKT